MANETTTATPAPPRRNWNIPKDQREAARAFLQRTLDDSALRRAVLADRRTAHDNFSNIGDINIPDDVEVICVEPSTQARAKLVVLILPESGDQLPSDLSTLKHWVAAWVPY